MNNLKQFIDIINNLTIEDLDRTIFRLKNYSSLEKKLQIAIEALEHYQSSHYTFENVPCYHDKTATEALEKIK